MTFLRPFFVFRFQLVDTELRYFESELDGVGVAQKGTIEVLARSRVKQAGLAIFIETESRIWELRAADLDTATAVAARLLTARSAATEQIGDSVDAMIESAAQTGQGFAEIKQTVVAEYGEDAFASRKQSVARAVNASAAAPGQPMTQPPGAGASTPGVGRGWLTKHPDKIGLPQRRWFQLAGTELQYYEHEEAGEGTDQKVRHFPAQFPPF